MSDICKIQFRANGEGLDLDIEAPTLAAGGLQLARQRFVIDPAELDELRGGDPRPALVAEIQDRLSSWLMQPGLDLPQTVLRLQDAQERRWRLVFDQTKVRDPLLLHELTELPWELLSDPQGGYSFVLHQQIASFVHLLPKTGNPRSRSLTWPLRVLLVRSAPEDLPPVPPALPLRDAILGFRPELVSNPADPLLVVDVLTSEDGSASGRPTRESLMNQIEGGDYHILCYLGHGDIEELQPDVPPVAQLLLESPGDDRNNEPLPASRLSALLHQSPVPVVLLVGCLTAANLPPTMAGAKDQVARWLRGNQGIAQALVNGYSGVQIAVGMRCRIDSADALRFLCTFFEVLLKRDRNPGDVEQAVRRARTRLEVMGTAPLRWAAPVVYRAQGDEPIFPYLAEDPPARDHTIPGHYQRIRNVFWGAIAQISWSQPALHDRYRIAVEQTDSELVAELSGQASIVMPALVIVSPDQLPVNGGFSDVRVPVRLHGSLSVRELEGSLLEASQRARLIGVTPDPALTAAGFEVLTQPPEGHRIKFLIRRPNGGGPAPLPPGPLFEVHLEIGSESTVVYPLAVHGLTAKPARSLCPGDNAVIVQPP